MLCSYQARRVYCSFTSFYLMKINPEKYIQLNTYFLEYTTFKWTILIGIDTESPFWYINMKLLCVFLCVTVQHSGDNRCSVDILQIITVFHRKECWIGSPNLLLGKKQYWRHPILPRGWSHMSRFADHLENLVTSVIWDVSDLF